ncbi:MAG: OmpA family protein [Oceanospirillaceae bacterium]|nr:OmpA family protein [Oceanospirillaceae bacterium]
MKKFALSAGVALAMTLSAVAQAHPTNQGYVEDSEATIWRNSFGECWHTGFWTEADAKVEGCDGYQAMAEPEPVPVAPAMVSAEKKFSLFFDFDSAVVEEDISAIVDYIGSMGMVENVDLVGNADFIGNADYNMALGQRRAEAVAAELQNAGVDGSKITVSSMGENAPVASCSGKGAALIACLRADRRVDVTISGETKEM